LREIEPHCVGLRALYSPRTAIVSYGQIAQHMAQEIVQRGGVIRLNAAVQRVFEQGQHVQIELADGEVHGDAFDFAIACCGL
ncbi:FAD-dependent oxidoreductase, partial [Salmonella enterica]